MKGSLWEEISAAMRSIGYNRNMPKGGKRNGKTLTNTKKLKEGNLKRSENSKTCSYFDQLDTIYREKSNPPIVAQPENQWPPAKVVQEAPPAQPPPELWRAPMVVQETPSNQPQSTREMDDQGSDNVDDYDDIDDDDEEDKDDESGGYEIVANKMSSTAAV